MCRYVHSVGFKPGQRKVLFTCLKRNLVREIKVAQLAGSVAEHSAYHHGEVCVQYHCLIFVDICEDDTIAF
jgi:DNA gyrase/topoisomerase IV subunit A